MQTLPYVVVTNPHMSYVYELYYKAFEALRRVREIKTVEDNDKYCSIVNKQLQDHLTVIPKLAMGVLECRDLIQPDEMDRFMNTLLRSRISRRVIAEQHLALTETFNAPWHFPDATPQSEPDFVGEVFLRCNAKKVIESCGVLAQQLTREANGPETAVPEILIEGHLDATFPYILSHLEYVIGELLRNSVQAVAEMYSKSPSPPPPVKVLICEAPQSVIIRISDQGGGVPTEILPHLWSFSRGPRSDKRLENLLQVPKMAATMQELKKGDNTFMGNSDLTRDPTSQRINLQTSEYNPSSPSSAGTREHLSSTDSHRESSLSSLTSRPPNLRLGMGLPMSRVYAEYWAGHLELHSLEGYGVDTFLQISKLGNKSEQLTTRRVMDAL
jgi:pyruvate dehydrogenase kinase 2/3/4